MRTIASLAVAAGLAVAASGAAECGCQGTCQAYGDPHVNDFFGAKWIEKELPSFTLYQKGDFAVTADTFSQYWMRTVTFGSESVSLDVCETDRQVAASWTHEFNADKAAGVGKSTLAVIVTCRKPTDGPVHMRPKFVFNVDLSKFNVDPSGADMTFLESEKLLGSTGACLGKGSGRLLAAAGHSAPSTCGCTAICQLRGDPHLDSFYDFHAKIGTQPDAAINLYKDGALSVDAELFDTWYIQKLTVGQHKTYSVESCSKVGQQLPPITVPALGGSLSVHVTCKLPGKKSLRHLGFHLDVNVAKRDNGKGSFPDQERAIGAEGLCTKKSK
jgi:hypothetical protein